MHKMLKSRVDIACRNNVAFGVSDDDIGEASDLSDYPCGCRRWNRRQFTDDDDPCTKDAEAGHGCGQQAWQWSSSNELF